MSNMLKYLAIWTLQDKPFFNKSFPFKLVSASSILGYTKSTILKPSFMLKTLLLSLKHKCMVNLLGFILPPLFFDFMDPPLSFDFEEPIGLFLLLRCNLEMPFCQAEWTLPFQGPESCSAGEACMFQWFSEFCHLESFSPVRVTYDKQGWGKATPPARGNQPRIDMFIKSGSLSRISLLVNLQSPLWTSVNFFWLF